MTWPNSDIRLDASKALDADIDPTRYQNIDGLPLVISFGVQDLGHTRSGNVLRYDWSRDCLGTHERLLDGAQVQFIEGYYPGFFTHPNIDAQELYKRFLHQFGRDHPKLPIGSYLSATTCMNDRAFPYGVEHYYPEGSISYPDFASGHPSAMGTAPFLAECSSDPGRWLLDLADQSLSAAFRQRAVEVVKGTHPRPEFVFLDNGVYLQPEFLWATGQKAVDCRDASSGGDPDCIGYQSDVTAEFGKVLYQDQFIDHYAQLVAGLEQVGVRSILNVTTPRPSWATRPRCPGTRSGWPTPSARTESHSSSPSTSGVGATPPPRTAS